MTKCYFEEGYLDTSVYLWEELPYDHSIQGPAIIIDKNRQADLLFSNVYIYVFTLFEHLCLYKCIISFLFFPPISTILVEPCCEARLTEGGDVCMTVGSDPHCVLGTELNTVQLSIFSHRFMSIAGTPTEERRQSGRLLGRN